MCSEQQQWRCVYFGGTYDTSLIVLGYTLLSIGICWVSFGIIFFSPEWMFLFDWRDRSVEAMYKYIIVCVWQ